MPKWEGKWNGGRYYKNIDGARVFVLEKMRKGVSYTLVLPAKTEGEANAALDAFMHDPEAFKLKLEALRAPKASGVVLDSESIGTFEKHQTTKHLDPRYVADTKRYLVDWSNALTGRELGVVRASELREMLKDWKGKNHRIAALKAFCSLAVMEERLTINPAASLRADTSKPARLKGKRAHSIEEVQEVYAQIKSQTVRDVVLLRAKSGMHHSEIDRMATGQGELDLAPENSVGIAARIRVIHKGRHEHRQSLDAQGLAAIQRLMARGGAPTLSIMARTLRDLTPRIQAGRLRHSFITWARKWGRRVSLYGAEGLSIEEIAVIVGHRSDKMIRDFYDDTEFPPMIVVPVVLQHVEDPPL